jgi:hypothetical protein
MLVKSVWLKGRLKTHVPATHTEVAEDWDKKLRTNAMGTPFFTTHRRKRWLAICAKPTVGSLNRWLKLRSVLSLSTSGAGRQVCPR